MVAAISDVIRTLLRRRRHKNSRAVPTTQYTQTNMYVYVVGLGPVLSLFNGTPPYRGRPYYNIRVRKTRSCFTWPTHSSARREIHRLVYCKHHVKSSVACYRIVLHRYRHVADLYSSLAGDCSIQRTKICKSILLNSPLDVHFG